MTYAPHKLTPVALTVLLLAAAGIARADDATLRRVVITGGRAVSELSPTSTSLLAVQPQSEISADFIRNTSLAGSNYSDIVNIAPSVLSVDPNGSGLMESQSLTVRGFQDGQYNVTFDGIPWGDSNDFTHHSTVYFMPQDLQGISVDRGPGDAASIGNATFGGSIALHSRDLSAAPHTLARLNLGSWNTQQLGLEHGDRLGDGADAARYVLSAKLLRSDGFLTHSGQQRQNIFGKIDKQLSPDTTLTAVAMFNHNRQHTPYGATLAQQAQYGYNFGLSKDPSSEANTDWNYDQLRSDFEYVALKTRVGDWKLDNKLYTYGYIHYGYYGWNPGSVSLADTQADGGTVNGPSNVPGGKMDMIYRSVGDILNASRDLGPGTLSTGLWFDHQNAHRFEQQVDWTLGGTPNAASGTVVDGAYGAGVDRDMSPKLTSAQAYLKYDWAITPDLTLNAGVREVTFRREINAVVNQKTLQPYNASASWSKALPSAIARYKVSPDASVYLQYAQGFLAPNLNVFYKSAPNLATVKPTSTRNVQAGANWSNAEFNGGVAVYRIQSTNLASGVACPAGVVGTCFDVSSGVTFRGAELEGSARLGHGFSLYANAALNDYSSTDGSVLQNTPKRNAALGLIYHDGPLYASLTDKIVSSRYSNVDAAGNNITLPGYAIAKLNVSYQFKGEGALLPRDSKLSLAVDNLFDHRGQLASLNSAVSGDPMFFVIPSRSVQLGLDLPF